VCSPPLPLPVRFLFSALCSLLSALRLVGRCFGAAVLGCWGSVCACALLAARALHQGRLLVCCSALAALARSLASLLRWFPLLRPSKTTRAELPIQFKRHHFRSRSLPLRHFLQAPLNSNYNPTRAEQTQPNATERQTTTAAPQRSSFLVCGPESETVPRERERETVRRTSDIRVQCRLSCLIQLFRYACGQEEEPQ